MKLISLKKDDVTEKLSFAKRRLQELNELNGGDLAGADGSFRQQLLQEFFFHLVGSIDLLAQFINEVRVLGLNSEDVTVTSISKKLASSDRIKPILDTLYRNSRESFPADPYNDEAYIYRIYNYRHQVTHRRRNPLYIFTYLGSHRTNLPDTSLMLDPRDESKGPSNKSALEELSYMYSLVESRCLEIIEML